MNASCHQFTHQLYCYIVFHSHGHSFCVSRIGARSFVNLCMQCCCRSREFTGFSSCSGERLVCTSFTRANVSCGVTTAQESEIHECPSVEKLSALKIAVEDEESPIMRQVFAWLFPFGPGWNSGKGFSVYWSVPLMPTLYYQCLGHFTSARACVYSFVHMLRSQLR